MIKKNILRKNEKMGIKGLKKFLNTKFSHLFHNVHLSEFRYKKISIDTSLYMCMYKAKYGEAGWLRGFIKLVSCLRDNEIHCVFIYDTGAPPEKEETKKARRENRQKMDEKIYNLQEHITDYHVSGSVTDLLVQFQEKRKLHSLLNSKINIKAIENEVEKMKKQSFIVTKEDFETTKKVFDILDVPYIDAPLEGEQLCSDLCIQGKVHAVLSEDSDVLAYGTPIFLTKINTGTGTCVCIRYEELLKEMELTTEQFLDFCIMCGTDYNKNIFKVGPVKAYNLIKEHGSIENIPLDTTILNHVKVREFFRNYEKSTIKVNYCGIPNFDKLKEFLISKNIGMDFEALKKTFVSELVFKDEED